MPLKRASGTYECGDISGKVRNSRVSAGDTSCSSSLESSRKAEVTDPGDMSLKFTLANVQLFVVPIGNPGVECKGAVLAQASISAMTTDDNIVGLIQLQG